MEYARADSGVTLADLFEVDPARIEERNEAITAGSHVAPVALATADPTSTRRRVQWWRTRTWAAEHRHEQGDYPLMTEYGSPSSPESGRRTHRMLYEGNGTKMRMPARTAIDRFSAAHGHRTFDVPVEIESPSGKMIVNVRVSKWPGGYWHVSSPTGSPAGIEAAEAVHAVLEAKRGRIRSSLTDAGNLLERAQNRPAPHGTVRVRSVNSSMISRVGYDPTNRMMTVEMTRGQVYGYACSESTFEAVAGASSVGQAYNQLVRGQLQRVGVTNCPSCGQFMAATGAAHTCATHGPRPGETRTPAPLSPTTLSDLTNRTGMPVRRRPVPRRTDVGATGDDTAPTPPPPPPPPPPVSDTEASITRVRSLLSGTGERQGAALIEELALELDPTNTRSVFHPERPNFYTGQHYIEDGSLDASGSVPWFARDGQRLLAGIDTSSLPDRDRRALEVAMGTLYIAPRNRCPACGQFTGNSGFHSMCPGPRVIDTPDSRQSRGYITEEGHRVRLPAVSPLRAQLTPGEAVRFYAHSDGQWVQLIAHRPHRRSPIEVFADATDPNFEAAQVVAQRTASILNSRRPLTDRRRTSPLTGNAGSRSTAGAAWVGWDENPYGGAWNPESSWSTTEEGYVEYKRVYDEARERRRNGEPVFEMHRGSVTGNPNATVGIEVEVVGVRDTAALAQALNSAGLSEVSRFLGYTESKPYTSRTWVAASDGSLRPTPGSRSAEVVTRPLPDTAEGWDELRRGLVVVRQHGGHVNMSCGAHLNVGLRGAGFDSDLTPYSNLVGEWTRSADTVSRLATNPSERDHRRSSGNTFTPPNRPAPNGGYTSLNDVRTANSRPHAVAMDKATPTQGAGQRVEFRVFDGVNPPNGENMTAEQWAEQQVAVFQARFAVGHGMVHAASRQARSGEPLGSVQAPPEPIGSRRGRWGRRNLSDDDFREASQPMLAHLDRWVAHDHAKRLVAQLWASTTNQG
jgi:hypothetical protein